MTGKKNTVSIFLALAMTSILGFSLPASVFAQETATIETHFRACIDTPSDGDWYNECHDVDAPLAGEPMSEYPLALNSLETGERLVAETDSAGNSTHTVPTGSYEFEGVPGHGIRNSYLVCSMVDEHGQPTSTLDQPLSLEAGDHVVCDYFIVSADYSAQPPEDDNATSTVISEETQEEVSSDEPTTTELENIELQIIPADCSTADQDGSLVDLSSLTIGSGEIIGAKDAINIATSWTSAEVSLETLIENDHALALLNTADGTVIACGNIGGVPGTGDALVIGLTSPEANDDANDVMVGVAYLQPDGEGVSISVFVREDIDNTD